MLIIRYISNDEFHNCLHDPNINETKNNNNVASFHPPCEIKCSEFRNIDKLRIIFSSIDKVLHL